MIEKEKNNSSAFHESSHWFCSGYLVPQSSLSRGFGATCSKCRWAQVWCPSSRVSKLLIRYQKPFHCYTPLHISLMLPRTCTLWPCPHVRFPLHCTSTSSHGQPSISEAICELTNSPTVSLFRACKPACFSQFSSCSHAVLTSLDATHSPVKK